MDLIVSQLAAIKSLAEKNNDFFIISANIFICCWWLVLRWCTNWIRWENKTIFSSPAFRLLGLHYWKPYSWFGESGLPYIVFFDSWIHACNLFYKWKFHPPLTFKCLNQGKAWTTKSIKQLPQKAWLRKQWTFYFLWWKICKKYFHLQAQACKHGSIKLGALKRQGELNYELADN